MGLDIQELFGGAEATQVGMKDALTGTGASALGFLEGKAIAALQANQAKNNVAAQNAISNVLGSPSDPNGFGAYVSGLIQNPALKQYGPYVIAGVFGVILLTLFLRG